MSLASEFKGFPKECPKFFRELVSNNNRRWFDAHKEDYENYVLSPARSFVVAMGEKLKKLIPRINADPRVNKSMFRIQRDIRFSANKAPYKTNMGLWFWEGFLPRMECSGFYFHLEGNRLMLAAGMKDFPPPHLEEYRQSVVDKKFGPELAKAIASATKDKSIGVGGEYYKRVPRGFDKDHKNAEYLLYNGLHVSCDMPIPREFYTPDLINFCYGRYKKMAPVHRWLAGMVERI